MFEELAFFADHSLQGWRSHLLDEVRQAQGPSGSLGMTALESWAVRVDLRPITSGSRKRAHFLLDTWGEQMVKSIISLPARKCSIRTLFEN